MARENKHLEEENLATVEVMEKLFQAESVRRKTREDGDTVYTGEYED